MSFDTNHSVRSDVLDAVVALIPGATRSRMRPYTLADLPAVNVLPDEETSQYLDIDSVERAFLFRLRNVVVSADDAEKLADQRYVLSSRALMADPTLGGRVRRIREVNTRFEMEAAEVEAIALVTTYTVDYSTSNRDPSIAAY